MVDATDFEYVKISNLVGKQGDPGLKGDRGDDGSTPTVLIGTVATTDPGSNATVTSINNGSSATLNITIPRGIPGPGAVAADTATAAYVTAEDSATKAALKAAFLPLKGTVATPAGVVLSGSAAGGFGANSYDTTPKLTLQSWQSPHNWPGGVNNVGGYGQAIRLDVMDPLAKNLLVWRMPKNPALAFNAATNPLTDVIWMGAHYRHRNEDGSAGSIDSHFHWSLEVPDSNGDLQTRFQVKIGDPATGAIGLDKTRFNFTTSDLAIVTSTTEALRMVGPGSIQTNMEWSTTQAGIGGLRWRLKTVESNMNKLVLDFHGSDGVYAGSAMSFHRDSGRVAFGNDTPSTFSRMLLDYSVGAENGFYIKSQTLGDGSGSIIRGDGPASAYSLLNGRVMQDAVGRFNINVNGAMEWGGGATARDTFLTRGAAGRLTTPGEVNIVKNLRIGVAGGSGGADGAIVLANAATPPSSNYTGGVIIYSENGVAKIRGGNGTITVIGPA